MKRAPSFRLGDLQLRIMKILWQWNEATVADVHEQLNGASDLAYTTVATMLRKMEQRGLVAHRAAGRSFVYWPKVQSDAVSRGMAEDLIDRLYEGSLSAMVSHLLTSREVSADELFKLERLIAKQRKQS